MRRLLLLLVVAGCSPDLPVPTHADIFCESDAHCPGDMVCNSTTERCVAAGRTDVVAPSVSLARAVRPEVGRRDSRFEVEVTTSEPLHAPAEVWFDRRGERVRLETDDGAMYRYQPTADDEDGVFGLRFRAVDVLGNVAEGALSASLRFDFTPPQVVVDSTVLRLEPDLGTNPVREVDGVTVGTAATVTFLTTESLRTLPVVETTIKTAGLEWSPSIAQGATFAFGIDWERSRPNDGVYDLRAQLVDLAGNTTTATLGVELKVDVTPPSPPDVIRDGAVVMHRSPWGTLRTGGAQETSIVGAAGSVEAGATVLALAKADVYLGEERLTAEIVRTRARADGRFGHGASFSVAADHPSLYLVAVDSVGNVSDDDGNRANGIQATLIRDVQWRASHLGKVAGSEAENPNELFARPVFGPHLVQGSTLREGWRLGTRSLESPTTVGAGSWRRIGPFKDVEGSGKHGTAYDTVRGRAIVFGEVEQTSRIAGLPAYSTWEVVGEHWRPAVLVDPEGDGNPEARSGHGLVYDPRRGRVVLYGGRSPVRDDLWEYDGFSWERRLTPDPEGDGDPGPRFDHAMTYDVGRSEVLIYGGCGRTDQLEGCGYASPDLWAYDGLSWRKECVNQACQATRPPARRKAVMAYDSSRKRTLMYGGLFPSDCDPVDSSREHPCFTSELFEWNGTRWTELCTASPCIDNLPPTRWGANFAYDPESDRFILQGGCLELAGVERIGCVSMHADTWAFDGSSWSEIHSTKEPRAGNFGDGANKMVYSRRHGGMLLTAPGFRAIEAWVLKSDEWNPLQGFEPEATCGAAMAYDEVSDTSIAFGGCDEPCDDSGCRRPHSRTRTWTPHKGWQPHDRPGSPPARAMASMFFDPVSQSVKLVGGIGDRGPLNDVWEWTGSGWVEVPSAGAGLPAGGGRWVGRDQHGLLAIGEARWGAPFMFRNMGASWEPICTDPQTCGLWGAFDAPTIGLPDGRVVLFGNNRADPKTYEWDGNAWTTTATSGPRWRRSAAATYDLLREEMLMYGGLSRPSAIIGGAIYRCAQGTELCEDLWAHEDGTWVRRRPADLDVEGSPPPLSHVTATMHGGAGMLTYGGRGRGDGYSKDSWLYDTGFDSKPGHVGAFVFGAAGTQRTEAFRGGSLRWCGSASGGIALHAWAVDRWKPLTVSNDAEGCAVWNADPATLAASIVGRDRRIHVAATPVDVNGAGAYSVITSEYVEVSVRYRVE